MQTIKINNPSQGDKVSLKSEIICDAEEEKLGDGKKQSFQKWISSYEGGIAKPFQNPSAYMHIPKK